MNILENGTTLPAGRRSRRPEVDHIFPHSKLQDLGIPDDRINHYANFRLISQPENNWKRAQDPQPYFKENPLAAPRYHIPMDLLRYDLYDQFLEKRREMIWEHINRFFGLNTNMEIKPDMEQVSSIDGHSPSSSSTSGEIGKEQPTTLRQDLNSILTEDQKNFPVLKDTSQWLDVFKKAGFNPQWSGRYYRVLYKVGLCNIGDFAAAITALRIKVSHIDYDLPVYVFVATLPGGSNLSIPTREFGGYAWKWVLITMENSGLNWKEYVIN